MANLAYFKEADVNEEDKFLTVGELISILSDVNPSTKVFIRNLDEWGEKPSIKNLDSVWELSDGLITDVKRANINQVTGEEEYIVLQGLINKRGFNTLDYEPYEETIYHHVWIEKMLKKITPIETMRQLKNKFLNVRRNCGNCSNLVNNSCTISKLQVNNDDLCELWDYKNNKKKV